VVAALTTGACAYGLHPRTTVVATVAVSRIQEH
jgi:hypothetical protein